MSAALFVAEPAPVDDASRRSRRRSSPRRRSLCPNRVCADRYGRNRAVLSAAVKSRARPSSRLAMTTAAGLSPATSAAKLGPDSTATGIPGATSTAISDIVNSDPFSIPLAQRRSGILGAIRVKTPRRNWAGTTITAASAPWSAAAGSVVAAIAGSSATPGRKMGLSWLVLIAATSAGSRAHSIGSAPARRATIASAVPHALPPKIARSPHRRAPLRDSAAGSSGQRGRTGASSPSVRPGAAAVRASAQAIIAPFIGTESAGGGATKARPASAAGRRKAPAQPPIRRDPARDVQGIPLGVMPG